MSRITELLEVAGVANPQATDELFALVYDELKRLAANLLTRESPGNTLQPTALVHEAYLRLVGKTFGEEETHSQWQGRGHFFSAAAEAMRRILIEAARRKKRKKHGGGRVRQTLEPEQIAEPEMADDLLALDEALNKLAKTEPKIAELVTLRYFGGLTHKDAATVLGIPIRTANAYWAYARAWLLAEINRGEDACR